MNSRSEDTAMRQSLKDQVAGNVREMKGKLKERTGRATGNPNLQDKGTLQKIGGKVQKKVGQVERVAEK
jgi:uncharacterized protein YjbJ (UPF0337 family)